MWIDDVYKAHTPTQIAEVLLATSGEEMLGLTQGVDLHRLVNLADRLTDLMLGLTELPARAPESMESEWTRLCSSAAMWPTYEPSVAAGAFGLSCALNAVFSEAVLDATTMLLATDGLEALPRRWEPPGKSATGEAIGVAFRTYSFVPVVFDIRLLWVALASAREERTRSSEFEEQAVEALGRAWMRFTKAHDPLSPSTLLGGLVLRQAVPFVHLLANASSNRPLDFSDLASLAVHAPSATAEHGASRVATVYQNRVAALFASFNGPFVSASGGEPLGDIYYRLPENEFMLIDAKSTGNDKGYTLPQRDADALRRYVENSAKLLPTSRPVIAVLIVGPSASEKLEQRLLELEDKTRCIVRFTSAKQLVSFRNAFPGGELAKVPEVLRRCSRVLPDKWWAPIVAHAQADNAEAASVRARRRSTGGTVASSARQRATRDPGASPLPRHYDSAASSASSTSTPGSSSCTVSNRSIDPA